MKKGFTLVELLAIVILLGIIFALVYPNIIELFEKKDEEIDATTQNAIYGAADQYLIDNSKTYPKNEGDTYCLEIKKLREENLIPIEPENYENKFVKIKVGKKGSSKVITDNCTENIDNTPPSDDPPVVNPPVVNPPVITYKIGDLVYFDPVNENSRCESDADVYAANGSGKGYSTNPSSTCYKWRIISVDSELTLMLDHNLIGAIRWVSFNDYREALRKSNTMPNEGWIILNNDKNVSTSNIPNKYGPITIMKSLANSTNTWTRVPLLRYNYDYKVNGPFSNDCHHFDYSEHVIGGALSIYESELKYTLNCDNGVCKTKTTDICASDKSEITISENTRARVITKEEVKNILTKLGVTIEEEMSTPSCPLGYNCIKVELPNGKIKLTDSKISWLTENTGSASTNIYGKNDIIGYWAMTPEKLENINFTNLEISYASYISSDKKLEKYSVLGTGTKNLSCIQLYGVGCDSTTFEKSPGARPVITINKDLVKK